MCVSCGFDEGSIGVFAIFATRWAQLSSLWSWLPQTQHGGHRRRFDLIPYLMCDAWEHIPSGKHTKSYWKWLFIADLPIKKWWFPIVMLVYQRVYPDDTGEERLYVKHGTCQTAAIWYGSWSKNFPVRITICPFRSTVSFSLWRLKHIIFHGYVKYCVKLPAGVFQ